MSSKYPTKSELMNSLNDGGLYNDLSGMISRIVQKSNDSMEEEEKKILRLSGNPKLENALFTLLIQKASSIIYMRSNHNIQSDQREFISIIEKEFYNIRSLWYTQAKYIQDEDYKIAIKTILVNTYSDFITFIKSLSATENGTYPPYLNYYGNWVNKINHISDELGLTGLRGMGSLREA